MPARIRSALNKVLAPLGFTLARRHELTSAAEDRWRMKLRSITMILGAGGPFCATDAGAGAAAVAGAAVLAGAGAAIGGAGLAMTAFGFPITAVG